MRLHKYYDAVRTNRPLFKVSILQKVKILDNIQKFLRSNKRIVVNHKPVVAQIEPTSQCNLGCTFCIRDKVGVPIGTMSFEDFKIILSKLDSLFKIHMSGQGEPFLNKDIFKMIDYANRKGIVVNLNSNGTLLTQTMIDRLCDVEIGEIAISTESAFKDKFEEIRKGANFDKLMENIKNLNRTLKERKKETIVSFAVTILSSNVEEIPQFVRLAKKVGINKLVIQTIQEKEDYVDSYDDTAKSLGISNLKNEMKKNIKEARDLAEKNNILFIFDEELNNSSPAFSGCIWPWRAIYITWNGGVTPCCKIITPHKPPVIGNIVKDEFWRLWNGKVYQMYRKSLRKREALTPCKGCNQV